MTSGEKLVQIVFLLIGQNLLSEGITEPYNLSATTGPKRFAFNPLSVPTSKWNWTATFTGRNFGQPTNGSLPITTHHETIIEMPTTSEANKWRQDGRCGAGFPLQTGEKAQCNPDSDKPCCDEYLIRNVSAVCENDLYSYQACGFGAPKTNSNVFCGGYVCPHEEALNVFTHRLIRCEEDCSVLRNCSDNVSLDSQSSRECDGKCDQWHCLDESDCNGHKYGVWCTFSDRPLYLPPQAVCDGFASCDFSDDEINCTSNKTELSCVHYVYKTMFDVEVVVPIHNYTRCSVFGGDTYPYCLGFTDQTNCSDFTRVGGFCNVQGHMSSVSKHVVCRDFQVKLCDDGMENNCFQPSESLPCKVHKHRMCDGVLDCPDGSDELHSTCKYMITDQKCRRRFGSDSLLATPVAWVMDGELDCFNGTDEASENWQICEISAGKFRINSEGNKRCSDVFLCPEEDKFVYVELLCDKAPSCSVEESVCQAAGRLHYSKTSHKEYTTDFCISEETCSVEEFVRPSGQIFGSSKIMLNVPWNRIDCGNTFGDSYVYLSCMNRCLNAPCPLPATPLEHDSCPGQYPDRVYTVSNSSSLTFVTPTTEGHYKQTYFRCSNGRCVDYKQLCDLVNDCGDWSDEVSCTNHFVCKNTAGNEGVELIGQAQKCDRKVDCYDFTDECNDFCGREILKSWSTKVASWMIGVLAVIFNVVAIVKEASLYKNTLTSDFSALFIKVHVDMVCLGNFLTGLYLVVLSVFDTVFGESFCSRQAEWLTSYICPFLGVVSTAGALIALFSITTLSIARCTVLCSPTVNTPGQASKYLQLSLSVLLLIVSSLIISLTPLAPDFVQGVYYDQDYKLFNGFQSRGQQYKILQAYYNTSALSTELSWTQIGTLVDGMFSQAYGTLSRSYVSFYGNNDVCFFKYFIRLDVNSTEIAERNTMTWCMLVVTTSCTILAMVMCILAEQRKSSAYEGSDQLKKKIRVLVVTNMTCWMLFVISCSLHNLGVLDATAWNVPFTLIVLSLNSAINPLVCSYSSFMTCRETGEGIEMQAIS
ncbi:hypothetical protein ACHWQZ_G017146 [Mnemiopsis leidyi]